MVNVGFTEYTDKRNCFSFAITNPEGGHDIVQMQKDIRAEEEPSI
jgi:hypothetical protein